MLIDFWQEISEVEAIIEKKSSVILPMVRQAIENTYSVHFKEQERNGRHISWDELLYINRSIEVLKIALI